MALISQLEADFPHINFESGDDFFWSPQTNTIYYLKKGKYLVPHLLHELSHALLDHTAYSNDVQLIAMERQAWDKAKELAIRYNQSISNKLIQSDMNSYRDWLHARSSCPNCDAIGVQTNEKDYKCIECSQSWHVNDAKMSELRRFRSNK